MIIQQISIISTSTRKGLLIATQEINKYFLEMTRKASINKLCKSRTDSTV